MMQQELFLFFKTPQSRFAEFHKANPHVYQTLILKCRQWRRHHPTKKLGIRMLWESMRWDYAMKTESNDFKLNDHYTPFYARLIMDCEPGLADIFEIRDRKAEIA